MLIRVRWVFESEAIAGIVHLAAILPTAAQRDPVRATRVNVDGSLNLVGNGAAVRRAAIVFGSSLSIYGTCRCGPGCIRNGSGPRRKICTARQNFTSSNWGRHIAQGHGLEFVSLRIGRVVGPGARSATSPWRSEIFELLSAPVMRSRLRCRMLARKGLCWFTWMMWPECW